MEKAPRCRWCGWKAVGLVKAASVPIARRSHYRQAEDGWLWKNYCSRSCSGEGAMALVTPEDRKKGTERILALNREATKRRVIKTIRQVMGEDYQDGDPVTLAQLIRLAQLATTHGAHAQMHRHYMRRVSERRSA